MTSFGFVSRTEDQAYLRCRCCRSALDSTNLKLKFALSSRPSEGHGHTDTWQQHFVCGMDPMESFASNRSCCILPKLSSALQSDAILLFANSMILQEPERRQNLWDRVQQLGDLLGVHVQSPVIPLVVGDEATALTASAQLLKKGFHVPAIRPPTVPKNTSR